MAKDFLNFASMWQNFAKSGHTHWTYPFSMSNIKRTVHNVVLN